MFINLKIIENNIRSLVLGINLNFIDIKISGHKILWVHIKQDIIEFNVRLKNAMNIHKTRFHCSN